MKQFLLGEGWRTAWYLLCYFFALFCVAMPLYMTWDYVREGKEPGPGGLAVFGMLILIPFFFGTVSLVNALIFLPAISGVWWHKAAFVLGLPTLLALVQLPPIFTLSNRPSWSALVVLVVLVLFTSLGNLVFLQKAVEMKPESWVLGNSPWLLGFLSLGSLPAFLLVLLMIVGLFARN